MRSNLPQNGQAMNEALLLNLSWSDWLDLFLHIASLSLVAVGGVVTVISAMHLYLVEQHSFMTDSQFNASYAMAQAAPGPNVLFVAMFGWMIGVNSGSMLTGLLGVFVILTGMLLPCSTLTFFASRWLQQNRARLGVRAFRQGMMPIVIALMLAAAWIIASAHDNPSRDWPLWLVTVIAALIVWRTRVHLLWLLAAGAILGWFGVI
jgi:chromate transporter